jgi:hypothetical protein
MSEEGIGEIILIGIASLLAIRRHATATALCLTTATQISNLYAMGAELGHEAQTKGEQPRYG